MREEARKQHELKVAQVGYYHGEDFIRHLIFMSDRPTETNKYYVLPDGTSKAVIGIEVETQCFNVCDQTTYANLLTSVALSTFHSELWKIENDCSLDDHGAKSWAEIISQPMSKAYIRNHYRDFKAMFSWFEILGIDPYKTGDCGMHCHINNIFFGRTEETQIEAIKKFIYIVNRHYDLMRVAVHRRLDADDSDYYFAKMEDFTDKTFAQNVDLNNAYNDHHACINFVHYRKGNIELRLVGGQRTYANFRNTMEVVFHLLEVVKGISWNDCDNIVRIFKGCNQYVFNRLSTDCKRSGFISEEELEAIGKTVKTEELL